MFCRMLNISNLETISYPSVHIYIYCVVFHMPLIKTCINSFILEFKQVCTLASKAYSRSNQMLRDSSP